MSFENEASYLIDTVEITKLWGQYDISTKFEKDINIFIGINGSYKTTFIMLIYNLLTLNFIQLIDVEFEKISIKIRNGRYYKYINFSKSYNKYNEKEYTFQIKGIDEITILERDLRLYGNQIFDIDDFDIEFKSFKSSKLDLKSKYSLLKDSLSKFINVDYININRHTLTKSKKYLYEKRESSIDEEIKELVAKFIKYQSEIKTTINNISSEFFKKSFEYLLNNRITNKSISINSETAKTYKESLQKMSKDKDFNGINFKGANNYIDETDKLIIELVDKLENKSTIKKQISPQEIYNALSPQKTAKLFMNLANFPKIQVMFDLYKESEKKKQNVESPTKTFMEISNNFLKSQLFPHKKLVISDDGSLKLKITDEKIVPLYRLSSGEKQLIIMLLRTLLQKGKKGIYITDEPELSLHISWQEKLISALNKINPNFQLIIATHSPDIVADYENKIKQMEDIIQYE